MIEIFITSWLGRAVFGLALLPLITFVFTSIRFHVHRQRGEQADQEPPTLPYALPWVGSGIDLIWNTHSFMAHVREKNDGRPVKVRLANEKPAYVVSNTQDVQKLFRASRELTFETFAVRVIEKVKKSPRKDAAKMGADTSGTLATPFYPVPESSRVWRLTHVNYETHLTGASSVSILTKRFVRLFQEELDSLTASKSSKDWSTGCINSLLEDKMFRASTRTLVSDALFDVAPNFTADFWEYDKKFMYFVYGLPRFLFPSAWQARERLFAAVKEYLARAWAHHEQRCAGEGDDDPDFDDHFGSRLVRTRETLYSDYGLSLDGRTAVEMGLIWSINSNAIPLAAWMLIEIISDPHLLVRVQREILGCVTTAKTELDMQRVLSLPLLTACYAESMRLHVSVAAIRELRTDIQMGGYTLKAGNLVMAPSSVAHFDEATWAGNGGPPASTFCADRFLRPAKGGEEGAYQFYNPASAAQYFPYGGGIAVCPGRFYAKAEILATVALFLFTLEVQPVGFVDAMGKPSERGPSLGTETRGTMRLDKDLKVLFRRRN